MDEIQYKLNTNNSVLVVNAIEKLINTVKTKYKPADRQKFVLENEELRFLRDKCSAVETVVSLTACQGLLALVESGVLEIGHTMSTVITLLPTAHNYSATISTMAGLLILDLKSRLVPGRPYVCQFSLRTPQHPFITVMERSEDTVGEVLTEMHVMCNHPDYTVSSNSLELLSTVFRWLTCHPRRGSSQRAWQLLLGLRQHSRQPELLMNCLSWIQTSNPKLTESCFAAYAAVTETALYQRQQEFATAILPVLAALSHQIIAHGRDPRACYSLMERCLATDAPELRWGASLTLFLLADNLKISCAAHLHELFNLCLNIIMKYDYPSQALNTFVGLSLPWLLLPSCLTNNALKVAKKILETHQNDTKDDPRLNMPNLAANKIFQSLMHTDLRLVTNFALFKTWERIRDNPDKIRSWFDGLEKIDGIVQLDLVSFLIGILMERVNSLEDVFLRALKMLVSLVDVKTDLCVTLLPVLLYKIANDKRPNVKLGCLKALPLMAKTKENVPTIVAVLSKLRSSKSLPHSLLISLHCSLVEVQVRCFPYLQEVLAETTVRHDDFKWEVEIARAHAVLRICETRPTQGLELVPIISGILNRCTTAAGTLSAATAVSSLRALWRARLLAPAGTWATLQPKLTADTREPVLISVCTLLSEVPDLRVSTPEYSDLAASACRTLWRLIAEGTPRVVEAACRALAGFELTDYSLRDIPEIYRKTVKLPASYCKTPEDAARNPEDVLDYIPCDVWPQVYKYTNQESLGGVRQLCVELVSREVRGYRSGVYQCEHPDAALTTLPSYSVLKGLANFLRKQAISPSYDCPDSVLLQILQTVAAEYPRPLPPMNLAFLHELFHRGAHWRQPCLQLAARQASTEAEARRFLDNYLITVDPHTMQEEDILTVFSLLPLLSRNMPPNSIRAPLEKCLSDAHTKISHAKAKDYTEGAAQEMLFVKLLEWMRVSLENEKIHDANRTLLSQFLENYFQVIGEDNVAWPAYVTACTALPTTNLERMTSPTSWWETSPQILRASCDVRCALAAKMRSAVWLNDVVDAAADFPGEQDYTLRRMTPALQSLKDDADTRAWIMQLMARTQSEFAESHSPLAGRYLWSVFTLSVVLVSGRWSFEPDATAAMFPAAMTALFSRAEWAGLCPRVLECLVHTRQVIADSDASLACHRALLCASTRASLPVALWTKAVHYAQRLDDL